MTIPVEEELAVGESLEVLGRKRMQVGILATVLKVLEIFFSLKKVRPCGVPKRMDSTEGQQSEHMSSLHGEVAE